MVMRCDAMRCADVVVAVVAAACGSVVRSRSLIATTRYARRRGSSSCVCSCAMMGAQHMYTQRVLRYEWQPSSSTCVRAHDCVSR